VSEIGSSVTDYRAVLRAILTSLRPFRPRRTGTENGSEVTRISGSAVTKRQRTLALSLPSSIVAATTLSLELFSEHEENVWRARSSRIYFEYTTLVTKASSSQQLKKMLTNVGRRLRRPLVRPLSRFSTSVAEPGASYAHVTRTSSLTPTVRLLELRVAEKQVPQQFVPGQWIDLFIPDQPTVGGYSICRCA
jgi:hypothetical protein